MTTSSAPTDDLGAGTTGDGDGERKIFLAALCAFLLLNVPMFRFERVMRSRNGHGVVALELAGDVSVAAGLLASWEADGRRAVRRSLWLDFPYLVTYTTATVVALRRTAAGCGPSRRGGWMRALVPAAVVAGACDAVENTALLTYLHRGGSVTVPVARGAASAKFCLLGTALVSLAVSPRQFWRGIRPATASRELDS